LLHRPAAQIDQRFLDTPYYITPNAPVGQEAFAIIREAMRGKGVVALGRLVLSKRERVIALEPYDKGRLGTTLRYADEVRNAEDYFCDLPELTLAPDILTLAGQIVDSKAGTFDPFELPRPSATYLRLAGFPRHRLRHSGGFVGAVILPPITTRCPLPPHSLHSIPAFIPVPWQRSHGTGTFSIVGGLAGMGASGSRIR